MSALVLILACLLALGLLAVIAHGDAAVGRARRWARDDAEASRFVAELQATQPLPPMAFYSTTRTPEAMRALAAEIAEDAERLEARHAYRGAS